MTSNNTPSSPASPSSPTSPSSPSSPSSPDDAATDDAATDDAVTDDLSIFAVDDDAQPTLPYPTTPLGIDGFESAGPMTPPSHSVDATDPVPLSGGRATPSNGPGQPTRADSAEPVYGYGGPAGPNRPAAATGSVQHEGARAASTSASVTNSASPNGTPPTDSTGPAAAAAAGAAAPRVRWAGIVWGLLFAAFGIAVMAVVSTDSSRVGFATWLQGLGPVGAVLVAGVGVGSLLVVCGVLGAIGRAQRTPR